jgi:hypothetical protein
VASVVLKEIEQLNELITVRHTIQTDVEVSQPRPPLGTEKIVLLVGGHVEAGVKLDEVTTADVRIDDARRSIEIDLPTPVILRAYIDEANTRVLQRTKPWFAKYDVKLDQLSRQDALATIRKTAMDMGIIDQARQNATLNVQGLLRNLGFDHVTVNFRETPQ